MMFSLTMIDITWNWLEKIKNDITKHDKVKRKLPSEIQLLWNIQREHYKYWHNMKFDYNKHVRE